MSASQISSAWILSDRINNPYVLQWTLDQISQFFYSVKINQDFFQGSSIILMCILSEIFNCILVVAKQLISLLSHSETYE